MAAIRRIPARITAFIVRLPLRVRLTAAFAGAMALVLLAFGAFLVVRLDGNLTRAIDQGLALRADQIVAAGPNDPLGSHGELAEHGDGIAQVLETSGQVLQSTSGVTRPLLSDAQIARLTDHPTTFEIARTQVSDDRTRILASRATEHGRTFIVAVGASVDARGEAHDQLLGLLLIGGPLALLLASGLGYRVAAGALRPVERMSAQAAAIDANDPSRLTVPPADDELHALATTLNAMLDRLHGAIERERAFTLDASHELRTPLAVLQAELEVALRPQRTADERLAALRSASEETERLVRLAEDLLVLARSDDQGVPVRASVIDVDEMLERVTTRFAEPAARRGIVVDRLPAVGVRALGDPDRLEQAVGNLVANALEHGAGIVVAAASESPQGTVVLSVTDDGDGFPPEFLPHAFERFAQADGSRHAAGAGLGLAIVKAIAEAHGGTAQVQNLTPGARVEVMIPAVEEN